MTNLDPHPAEIRCSETSGRSAGTIAPREVPLGGPRAMTVRRTLPSRERSLIGAWCFLDHYGPDDVSVTGGMRVPPHPHTGLQTVSWLFTGEIEHRDSAGNRALVRPGELNLMTGGHGISHSEVSTDSSAVLHGAQLWVALPDAHRDAPPRFDHHRPTPITGPGWTVRVFLGSLLGDTSPVPTFTPLLGAEILLEPSTSLTIPVDVAFEHGVLVDTGGVAIRSAAGESLLVGRDHLAQISTGASSLTLEAGGTWTRVLLLGGPPFGESIVMWWNFVGRSHEEVVAFREEWQAAITDASGGLLPDSQLVADSRFGVVVGDHLPPIPAPPLPGVRLRPRR